MEGQGHADSAQREDIPGKETTAKSDDNYEPRPFSKMASPDSRSMKNLEGKFTDPEELNSQNIHDTPKENTGGNQGGSNGRVTVSFKSTQKRDLKLMGKTKYKNGKAVDSGFYSHARGKGGK
jgi:hypothetical protein